MDIFNIKIEFNHDFFLKTIDNHIQCKQKGYICVVDGSVLTKAQKDIKYRQIVNDATINTCDGSSIAMMANLIYKTDYRAFNGPEIFKYYIEQPYRHVLVGNTIETVNAIKNKVRETNNSIELYHIDVPFLPVEDFDYKGISEKINDISPDIIWVSLGNPKQEIFMSNILPYINKGVMFGIGAAFNFYINNKNYKNKHTLGSIWIKRVITEPKKQWGRMWRYIFAIPRMYFDELKKSKM